ncbi:MAG TPA: rod shape-determining protein MreC [Candidatus Paceibacterota bacterium]|nr:rod shape-determining protein MreC [Candidatus Paceibacterota bacterium]
MISPNLFDRSQKSRRRSVWSARLPLLVLAAVLCVVVIVWQNQLGSVFWRVAAPPLAMRNTFSQSQVSILQAELASTTAALADRNTLYQQNLQLKALLGRPQISNKVLSGVLLRPPGLPYDTLMIDAGTQHGIAAGDLVFAGGTLAIGEISDAYTNTSRVSLFSAPGRTYDAQVAQTDGSVLPFTLVGQGSGSFSGEVPANSTVSEGDSVVVPGLGSYFLGSISHIDAPAGSSFETLYVQMPVNIFSLQYVEVQSQ